MARTEHPHNGPTHGATPIPLERARQTTPEITHDITDRQHSEQALRESEQRLRALVTATSKVIPHEPGLE